MMPRTRERLIGLGVGVLATMMSFALIEIATEEEAEPAPASKQIALCSDEPGINDQIDKIAFQALDDALRDQIQHLFATWMKDESGQPARASVGVKQSALAYVHAREAILQWHIPPCKQ